jgi:hypothetical protein
VALPTRDIADAGNMMDDLLQGAAAALSLTTPYCWYLAAAQSAAAAAASDQALRQPQRNHFTVFAETWHAASLAHLADVDIANAWRLADYLLLDEACLQCLEDVMVQRLLRTDPSRTHLISLLTPFEIPAFSISRSANICRRTTAVDNDLIRAEYDCRYQVARGIRAPRAQVRDELKIAAEWGHWRLMQPGTDAHAEAAPRWDFRTTAAAAWAGQLQVLQMLRRHGCDWDPNALDGALVQGHHDVLLWALANGAPRFRFWTLGAARCGCLPALQWAHECGDPTMKEEGVLDCLRGLAASNGHQHVVEWLDSLQQCALEKRMGALLISSA